MQSKLRDIRVLTSALLLIAVLALAGCQEQATSTPTPAPASTETAAPAATEPPVPTATSEPTPTTEAPASPAPPAEDLAVAAVRQEAARLLGSPADVLTVDAVEPMDWQDSCLGLGGPAESCLQAITPGYRITVRAGDQTAIYRTDLTGDQVRQEEPETATPAAAAQAQVALAEALGYLPDQVEILSATAQEWPDGCLGLGAPDEGCLQAITPGYEVTLVADDREFVVRTDDTGDVFRFASAAEPAPGHIVLRWQREGGIAGFCDQLAIQQDGQFAAGTCTGTPFVGTLSAEQLAQLEDWVASYRPIIQETIDDAVADAMTTALAFLGAGTQAPLGADQQAMVEFAAAVYAASAEPEGSEPVSEETQEATPEASDPGAWVRVLVPELEMSFPVRAGWTQLEDETTWQTEAGMIRFEALAEDVQPASRLPAGSEIATQTPVDLGWATGQRLQVRLADAGGFATYYFLTDPDGQRYLFAATALTVQDLDPLAEDLSRLVSAITFSEGEDKVSGPTQTVVDFLAAWLYDESDIARFLSQRLESELAGGAELEDALAVPGNDYRTFNVEWLSTANGQSQVRIILTYAAGTQVRVLDLIEEDGRWVIDGASR